MPYPGLLKPRNFKILEVRFHIRARDRVRETVRYFPLETNRTASILLKSVSCVQMVALYNRAVAKMILSAMGSFKSQLIFAALKDKGTSRSIISPFCIKATDCKAEASSRCCKTRLKTSKIHIAGTISFSEDSRGPAKKSAFEPSARYSSQPEESTRFMPGPCPFPQPYRCRLKNLSFSSTS